METYVNMKDESDIVDVWFYVTRALRSPNLQCSDIDRGRLEGIQLGLAWVVGYKKEKQDERIDTIVKMLKGAVLNEV